MKTEITFVVNGKERTAAEPLVLGELLEELGFANARVAVELNLEVVPRDRHAETTIKDGDRLEIVSFVGGG